MKSVLNILKLFFLDWVILVVMYTIGSVVVGFDPQGYVNIVVILSSISPSSMMADLITYIFIDTSVIIFISYLINNYFIKIPRKLFIISQILFIFSIPCVIALVNHLL